ncbi:Signal-transduction histidine kinase senX3 [Aliarcobacter thereius]|uniref:histidine kinase n=2 Tax=Aliarcobacter thereius TaxID=544718 RepID=A0A1C0B5F7_9BACT|nr:HAMP domain-containing sensor histidine kinase [Aliarcobacter thereius]OCL86047.1 Signal-transduction histidine kinase senX3 [Aliarcobacter thereius]OCL90527.1 Signal-transduction histidine kinase senX3 [Aliarcobacter thereius]OCL95666.1 Signal-transduction histidine kinase senX3 [Aliarcobacter thereius LMG 24486]OCL97948.1 Signal-transduction histidine kinase senX3 [Aliarcobacter thereius]QBF16347.1 two-component system sensor histidine kinase [Aliarcobacter thereius LMG 24486]
MKNSRSELKYILIQALITLFIAFIPIYFYIDASIKNQDIKDRLDLQNYSNQVILKIDSFTEQNGEIFYFPRSNIFYSTIFDENKNEIFSTNKSLDFFENEYKVYNDIFCYKKVLSNNILDKNYLVVCKDIDYSEVIYNVLILISIVSLFIFVLSFLVIKQSIEPYKKLNTYLDEFLKDAMHELKTPIGVARINIDMLSLKLKNDKNILRVKSALKNMTIIYEDLEYYMQQNAVKEEKRYMNISSFLEKRVEFFNDLATSKNIVFHKNIEQNIDIFFNEIELYRIVDNNLSNAIKYSKNNSNIYVKLEKKDNKLELAFKDEGIGIKDTSTVFERYYRGDNITGGFGIGLSIVKNICLKNGVKVNLESKENQGSTFTYIFNL